MSHDAPFLSPMSHFWSHVSFGFLVVLKGYSCFPDIPAESGLEGFLYSCIFVLPSRKPSIDGLDMLAIFWVYVHKDRNYKDTVLINWVLSVSFLQLSSLMLKSHVRVEEKRTVVF